MSRLMSRCAQLRPYYSTPTRIIIVFKQHLINGFGIDEMAACLLEHHVTGDLRLSSCFPGRPSGPFLGFRQTRSHAINLRHTRDRLTRANNVKSWARFLKYGCVYLHAWETESQVRVGIGRWIHLLLPPTPSHCPWRTTTRRHLLQRNHNRSAGAGRSLNYS